jgi:hypothetical protein
MAFWPGGAISKAQARIPGYLAPGRRKGQRTVRYAPPIASCQQEIATVDAALDQRFVFHTKGVTASIIRESSDPFRAFHAGVFVGLETFNSEPSECLRSWPRCTASCSHPLLGYGSARRTNLNCCDCGRPNPPRIKRQERFGFQLRCISSCLLVGC